VRHPAVALGADVVGGALAFVRRGLDTMVAECARAGRGLAGTPVEATPRGRLRSWCGMGPQAYSTDTKLDAGV